MAHTNYQVEAVAEEPKQTRRSKLGSRKLNRCERTALIRARFDTLDGYLVNLQFDAIEGYLDNVIPRKDVLTIHGTAYRTLSLIIRGEK